MISHIRCLSLFIEFLFPRRITPKEIRRGSYERTENLTKLYAQYQIRQCANAWNRFQSYRNLFQEHDNQNSPQR